VPNGNRGLFILGDGSGLYCMFSVGTIRRYADDWDAFKSEEPHARRVIFDEFFAANERGPLLIRPIPKDGVAELLGQRDAPDETVEQNSGIATSSATMDELRRMLQSGDTATT